MPAEALFLVVVLAAVAAGSIVLVARAIAGARFDHAIEGFEPDLASRLLPRSHDRRLDERR